jgi:hypothetical protein
MSQPGSAGLPPLADEDHVCAGCGMSYADTELAVAVVALRAVPDEVRAAALAAFTVRLHRMSTEEVPALEPMFADLRAVRFRYNDFELDAVLAELDAHIAGFLDEIAVTTDWDRTATRRPEELRTARWLVRHALHEARHHTQDVAAVGRAVAGG